jgi:hypothetical protein
VIRIRRSAALGTAVAVPVVLVVTACGSGANGSPSAPRTASSTAFSEPQLKARLIGLAEMPSGYVVDVDVGETAIGRKGTVDIPKCQALADVLKSGGGKPEGALAEADNQFKRAGDGDGTHVSTALTSFPTDVDAQAYLDRFAKATHECTAYTDTAGVGDSSTAVHLSLIQGDVPSQIDILAARVGNTLLTVVNVGHAAADIAVTQAVADKALAKLKNPLTASVPTSATKTGFRPQRKHRHEHRHGNPWFGF